MKEISKILIVMGSILIGLGILFYFVGNLPFKFKLFKLPGDIYVEKENFRFYFPITTSIILSILLSLLFYIFSKFN